MSKASVRLFLLSCALLVSSAVGQQGAIFATAAIPKLINFSGTLTDLNGKPLTGVQGVSFLLYATQQGGNPLWMETQNITPGRNGQYTATLGVTAAQGLPDDIFLSGEARWLAVQVVGQPEQPRILLVAVPYALKAADAQTIGGLPPSAFVLALPPSGTSASPTDSTAISAAVPLPASSNVTTTGGTVNALPLFTTATNIQNSILTQSGTTAINVAGKLNLPATGTATSTGGKNSRPEVFVASAFNSGTATAVPQTFQLQAEPVNNNTASPSGTLNLLFAAGTTPPVETGLKIGSNGRITFASGQTFPGAGTVTSVGLSAPTADFKVTGSPVTNTGVLNVAWKVAPTSADTANAIVKRDATGSFNATSINASGQVTVTNGSSLNPILTQASAPNATAIVGSSKGTGLTDGVMGSTVSSGQGSSGVIGIDLNSAGSASHYTAGVTGDSLNPYGIGVLGYNGVNGLSQGFQQTAGFQRIGVWGDAESGGVGLEGIGVVGKSDTGVGVLAENGPGACCGAILAYGGTSANTTRATGLPGVVSYGGNGDQNTNNTNGGAGVVANGGNQGPCSGLDCATGGPGIMATGGSGTEGPSSGGPGQGGVFMGGSTNCTGNGCGGDGIYAVPAAGGAGVGGLAGNFNGDIEVDGRVIASIKDFKIDHPLDPSNKYLVHASVESSEMKNIYDGMAVTDTQGEATVQLPEWFEALNTDFRYQLTVIGQFAQAIVAREIENHEFMIRTNLPGVKVSWQVTGVRQDAYARAHPLIVEEQKNARLRGFYLHPELYGAPEEKQIEWARHPAMMKALKEQRMASAAKVARTK